MKALQFSWFTAVSFCTALFPATNSIPLQFLSWNFLGKAKLKRYVWRSRGYLPAFFEPGSPLIKEAKSEILIQFRCYARDSELFHENFH